LCLRSVIENAQKLLRADPGPYLSSFKLLNQLKAIEPLQKITVFILRDGFKSFKLEKEYTQRRAIFRDNEMKVGGLQDLGSKALF